MATVLAGTRMRQNGAIQPDTEYPMESHDSEIDLSGLNCPLPILRTKKALSAMESGKVLKVIATDPGAVKDFEVFARQTGHALLQSQENSGKYYFLLRKA